jgi:hypothetical protein
MANEGLGGTFLFAMLYVLFYSINYRNQTFSIIPYLFFSFFGFLVFGLGLWLITLSGKPDSKQNP